MIIAGRTPTPTQVQQCFSGQLKERIYYLDGGMGAHIHSWNRGVGANKRETRDRDIQNTKCMV